MPYWLLIIFAYNVNDSSHTYIPFDTEVNCTKAIETLKGEMSKIPEGKLRPSQKFIYTCLPTGR